MEDLSKYSPTRLLKMGNDIKKQHDILKSEIIELSIKSDGIEKQINAKILKMNEIEENYVTIVAKIEEYAVW